MRVLIVDDHPITRAALAALLEGHGFSVAGEAADGAEAIELARRLLPDIVLLDLSMPGLDGLQALPRLREAALSGEVARRLLDQVREGGTGRGVPDEIAASLSARELEVLLLLDEHLATDEIAGRLFISEHTVRSHVKSLLRKLNVSSRREALDALASARAA